MEEKITKSDIRMLKAVIREQIRGYFRLVFRRGGINYV